MLTVKTINLTGIPATLSQQAFGVFEPDDVGAVRMLLELGEGADMMEQVVFRVASSCSHNSGEGADMMEQVEELVDIAVQHQAELAMLEKGTAFSDVLGRALLRRGIRTIYATSRVFSLYP